jgi:hypothetical protein
MHIGNSGTPSTNQAAFFDAPFLLAADAARFRLMAAEVDAKPGSFAIKKVDKVFGPLNGLGTSYDVSADGQRFPCAGRSISSCRRGCR